MSFTDTLITVFSMLLYAVPGYLLMKTKMVEMSAIPALSRILVFVCQPCFAVYAYNKIDFSARLLLDVVTFMLVTVVLQVTMIYIFSFLYKKRWDTVKYRICTIASCFGNAVFFGAPVIEVLMPHFAEAIIYANAYGVAMNILAWTVGSSVITKDKSYVKIKKVILNPATIGFIIALILYVSQIKITGAIENSVSLLAKMTTPVSMLILGMRLATVRIKPIFTTPLFYFTIFFKQMIFPLISYGFISLFPFISKDIRTVMFIVGACPVASIVLNFAEMLEGGQEEAADIFLLGTILSIVTMPVIIQVL